MNSVDDKTASFFESKKILISGASGYIGSNLLNRLSEIKCEIACLTSNPKLKEFLVKEYKNRRANITVSCGAYRDRSLWEKNIKDVDVIFTALPNGEAQKIARIIPKKIKLIDLSADFRLNNHNDYKKWYKLSHKAKNNIE